MQHQEIVLQLETIPRTYKSFKQFESSVGGHEAQREKMPFTHYLQQILNFNTQSKGDMQQAIQRVTIGLSNSKPDFHQCSLSRQQLERYSLITGGKSKRMEGQLMLSKLLEVKELFKDETDIFNPQNIKRVEAILKEIK